MNCVDVTLLNEDRDKPILASNSDDVGFGNSSSFLPPMPTNHDAGTVRASWYSGSEKKPMPIEKA